MNAVTPVGTGNVIINDLDDPVPHIPIEPPLWKIFAMPVKMRKVSRGGIIFADDTVDVQLWHHQLFRIVKVGKQVYRGPAYASYDIAEDDILSRASLAGLAEDARPLRLQGQTIIILNDDQLRGRIVEEDCVQHLKFYGFELG